MSAVIHREIQMIAALFAGVLLALGVTGCADLGDEVALVDENVRLALPSQEFYMAELTHTDEGDTSFILTADLIQQFERSDMAKLFGTVTVHFYKEGRKSSDLTADSGQVLFGGKELRATGHVEVITDSGWVIQSPRLIWTSKDHLIRSDTSVVVITDLDTLYGVGLIATDDLKTKRILQPTGVSHRKEAPGRGGGR